jgi:hypothetical protein
MNRISKYNRLKDTPPVTQLNEYDVPPPSCSVPPSNAKVFDAVTLIIEVEVYEHTCRVSVPPIRLTSLDPNDSTESRVNVPQAP